MSMKTNAQLLAECRRLEPSFRVHREGRRVAWWWGGSRSPHEFTIELTGRLDEDERAERVALERCLAALR
jgi:hypothetical protein